MARGLGETPKLRDDKSHDAGFSPTPVYRHLETWGDAVRAAGLEERSGDGRDRPGADELRRPYHDEGLSMWRIAERYGFATNTVHHWMERNGIDRRSGRRGGPPNPLLPDRA